MSDEVELGVLGSLLTSSCLVMSAGGSQHYLWSEVLHHCDAHPAQCSVDQSASHGVHTRCEIAGRAAGERLMSVTSEPARWLGQAASRPSCLTVRHP